LRETIAVKKLDAQWLKWATTDWDSFKKFEYRAILADLRRQQAAEGLHFARCGAKTRKGTSFQCKALDGKWRWNSMAA